MSILKTNIKKGIIYVLVCVMALTAFFVCLPGDLFAVKADAVDLTAWPTPTQGFQKGYTYNITLTADQTYTCTDKDHISVAKGQFAEIPEGTTVVLDLKGHSLNYELALQDSANGMCKDYTSDINTGARGNFWGLIRNKGNLTIKNTGTGGGISIRNACLNYKLETDYDDIIQRVSAIVNKGELTLEKGVNVNSYMVFDSTGLAATGDKYADLFQYSIGIYNEGTVTSNGANIEAGCYTASAGRGKNAFHYAVAHGIYGGKVNVNGGIINALAYSGSGKTNGGTQGSNDVVEVATGITSNNAVILGSASITSYCAMWQAYSTSDSDSHNCWGSGGTQHALSAGVLYTGTNYPVIGASVNMSSSTQSLKGSYAIPGYPSESRNQYTENSANNCVRKAYLVAGVTSLKASLYGAQTTETTINGTNWFGSSSNDNVTASSCKYITETNYLTNNTEPANLATVFEDDAAKYCAQNNDVKNTGRSEVKMTCGAPGEANSQYVILYAYSDAKGIKDLSYAADENKNYSGVLSDTSGIVRSDIGVKYASGGQSVSPFYYTFSNVTYEQVDRSSYCARSISEYSQWSNKKNVIATMKDNQLNGTASPALSTGGKVTVIYFNYILKNPGGVRIAVCDKTSDLTAQSTGTTATMDYTGKAAVPNVDFKIAVISLGADISISVNSTKDDVIVTKMNSSTGESRSPGYNVDGKNASYKSVAYSYAKKGESVFLGGLPTDAGTYDINVVIEDDIDISVANSANRKGGDKYKFTLTIKPANITVSGISEKFNGVYGESYGDIVNTSTFTVKGVNSENPKGTFTFKDVNETDIPSASASASGSTVTVIWTPNDTFKTKYAESEINVTIYVSKREATVKPGTVTVTYGDIDVTYGAAAVTVDNIAECDKDKVAGWVKNSTFGFREAGDTTWLDYSNRASSGLYALAGTYELGITSFGGADNSNYVFTVDNETNPGVFTVDKKDLNFSIIAKGREYNGSRYVDVKFTMESALVTGTDDAFNIKYNKKENPSDTVNTYLAGVATVDSASVGNNKVVSISDTDIENIEVTGNHSSCYRIKITNTPKINITKASITVSDIQEFDITYDSALTLYDAAPETLISADTKASYDKDVTVDGTWSWKTPGVVPAAGEQKYQATFTPEDTANYSSVTADIPVNVAKAVITVSVPGQEIVYGDAVPALTNKVVYTGWTGSDKLADISTTGTVTVTTSYKSGMTTGNYPISVTSTLASANYEFTVSSTVTFVEVNKKDLTVTPKDYEIVYGDEKPEFDETDVVVTGFYGDDTIADLGGAHNVYTVYNKNDNAGDYDILCTNWTSDNYKVTCEKGKLTVKKAVLTVKPVETNITYGADIPAFECTYSGFKGTDTDINSVAQFAGTVKYDTSYSKGSNAHVSYTVTSDVSDLSSLNYTFASDSNIVNVDPCRPSIITNPTATITFTESLGQAVFTNAVVVNRNDNYINVEGRFAFNKKDTVPEYSDNGKTEYVCTFTPNDSVNYTTETFNCVITIEKKAITGVPVINGSAMAGQTLEVNFNSVNPFDPDMFDIQWVKGDTDISGQIGSSYKVVDGDIDSTIKVRITAKAGTGYTGSAESVPTAKIFQSLKPVTVDALTFDVPENLTFDNEVHYAEVAIKSEYKDYAGKVTVLYNGSTDIPRSAGTYYVTCNVAEPSLKTGDSGFDENYFGPTSGINLGTFTISPKDYTVSFTVAAKQYDGTTVATPSNVEATGKINGTDVVLKQGTYVYDRANVANDIIVTALDMSLTGADKDNYRLVVQQALGNIIKRDITAKASAVTRAYNDTNVVDITFTQIANYAPGETKDSVYFTNGKGKVADNNVGTKAVSDITYNINGEKADNYNLVITNKDSVTCIITKADPNIIPPVISGLTYDKTRKLGAVDLSTYTTSIGKYVFDNVNEIPTCAKTKYAAKFVSTNSNYNSIDCEITINLNKKNVTLIPDSIDGTYGQVAPSLTVTAIGFTGDDSLTSDDVNVISGFYNPYTTYEVGNKVGEYVIYAGADELSSPNYTFTQQTGKLTIKKAVVNVTATAESKVYDGNKYVNVTFAVKDGVYAGDVSKVYLSIASTTGTARSSQKGDWGVTYTEVPQILSADDTANNYDVKVTPASGALVVKITPAMPTGVIFPVGAEMTFGNPVSTAAFITDGEGQGRFEFADSSKKPLGVGTEMFTVKFVPDDDNYMTITQDIPVTVNIAEIEFVLGVAGSTNVGSVLTPVLTGCPKDAENYLTYVWYREQNNRKYIVSNERTYVTTEEDEGCLIYVLVYFDASSPYQLNEAMTTETLAADGNEGIVSQTTSTIREKVKTFWQRLVEWFRALIEAITNIRFGL